MYKIEEFVGTAGEVIKHFNLSHIVSRQAKTFAVDRTLVFYGNDKYILNMLKKTYVKIA